MDMQSTMASSMESSAMGSMAMGTQTSATDMMPTATAAMDHTMDMGMDMGSGSCKVNVSTRLNVHLKVRDADPHLQMLWNWNTIDACKRGICLVLT